MELETMRSIKTQLQDADQTNAKIAISQEQAALIIKALKKQVPREIKNAITSNGQIAGYCPDCDGTICIKSTFLIKATGQCCNWCGQKLKIENHLKAI